MITSDYSQISKNPVSKFNQLRKGLDQYGYNQPLGLDSVSLVEKLFVDFLETTNNLKRLMDSNPNKSNTESITDNHEERKNEFENLLHENNNLYLKIINCEEELQKCSKEYRNKISLIDKENKHLKLLNNQYMQKVQNLEKESTDKSNIILKIQDKYFFAAVQITGPSKGIKNQFRQPKMELNSFLPNNVNCNIKSINTSNDIQDPKYIDLLKLTEDNLFDLRDKLNSEVEKSKNLEEFVNDLQLQIENRNAEIYRLSQLSCRETSAVDPNKFANSNNSKEVADLQQYIDILLEEKRQNDNKLNGLEKLETQNNKLNTKLDECVKRISQFEGEINKEKDKSYFLSTEVDRLKLLLLSKDQSIKDLEENKDENEKNNTNSDIIMKLQSDKKRLASTISNLMNTERELILEIDRLKKMNIHRKPLNASMKSTKNLNDAYMANLEMERDFWKGEFNALQKVQGKFSHNLQGNNFSAKKENVFPYSNNPDFMNDDIFLRVCKERDELMRKLEIFEKQTSLKQTSSKDNQSNELFTEALDEFSQSKKKNSETVNQLKDEILQHKSLTSQLRLISKNAEKSLKECQDNLLKKKKVPTATLR